MRVDDSQPAFDDFEAQPRCAAPYSVVLVYGRLGRVRFLVSTDGGKSRRDLHTQRECSAVQPPDETTKAVCSADLRLEERSPEELT